MLLESCIPSSVVEVGKQDVCISVLKSYRLQKVSLDKSGGFIQSCKLCGHSENVLNMLLCEEAPNPNPGWFCQLTSGFVIVAPKLLVPRNHLL